ncbi:MAG: hypothetical protein K2P45_09290 [Eubacterium sp.]|nr:hypothetical protein [Eubacterium sp.]
MKAKKTAVFVCAVMSIGILGTVLASNVLAFGGQSDAAIVEEAEDVSLKNIRSETSGSRDQQFYEEVSCEQISQKTEESFLGIDGIASADADVSYDAAAKEYAVELSLVSDTAIDQEQEELFRKVLDKTFDKVTLKINGVIR